jgi:hypothetical protein
MTGNHGVTAIFEGQEPPKLTVDISGSGSGSVTSEAWRIDCRGSCSYDFAEGTTVTLTAVPDEGSVFSHWGGCDTTDESICTVEMRDVRTVTATFEGARPTTLTVDVSGTGSGSVFSEGWSIDCRGSCSYEFTDDTTVTLTAVPDEGSEFAGWDGACTGTDETCVITITDEAAVYATFEQLPKFYKLTVVASGPGRVGSNPTAIDCPGVCSYEFAENTTVTLTAVPDDGSEFYGWDGACTGAEVTCVVTVTDEATVYASFGGLS